jgi:hypothetical protein
VPANIAPIFNSFCPLVRAPRHILRINPLRDDALKLQLAGGLEHRLSILRLVIDISNPAVSQFARYVSQHLFARPKRIAPVFFALQKQQVENEKDKLGRLLGA